MKIFLTLIFSSLLLFSSQNSKHLRVKLLEKIFTEINVSETIVIWSDNSDILEEFEQHHIFQTTKNCKDATIIILQDKSKLTKECADAHIFVLNYKLLSDIPHSFGALFWKKGRPNIVIIEPRIESQAIKVSENLAPYLEDKIW